MLRLTRIVFPVQLHVKSQFVVINSVRNCSSNDQTLVTPYVQSKFMYVSKTSNEPFEQFDGASKYLLPPLKNSLELARTVVQTQAGVEHVASKFLSRDKDFSAIENVKEISSDLEKLVKNFEDLVMNARKKEECVSYFLCLYRIVEHLDERCKQNQPPIELKDPRLCYLQWLTYFLHEMYDISFFLWSNNKHGIMDHLIEDLEGFARSPISSEEASVNAPKAFNIQNPEEFINLLVEKNAAIFGEVNIYKLLTYKYSLLWHLGHFSKSLTVLATVLEFFAENAKDPKVLLKLGPVVIGEFSLILRDVSAHNMAPAVDFIDIIIDKINNQIPIVPYLVSIQYQQSESLNPKASDLKKRYPNMLKLYDPVVESRLVDHNTKKTKFLKKWLRGINKKSFPSTKQKPKMSPDIHREMVDIKILEMLASQQVEEALNFVELESAEPSRDVFRSLLHEVKASFENVVRLRQATSIDYDGYPLVCEEEIKQRAQSIYVIWKQGEHQEALSKMLRLYTSIVENEYYVSEELVSMLLKKLRRYFNIFSQEIIFQYSGDKADLEPLREASKALILAHDHYDLHALYWEVFAFSPRYKDQNYSDEIFLEVPQLPRRLDFDSLLDKADRFQEEHMYRKLLETSLQYDLNEESKQAIFDKFLTYYCKVGNFAAATGLVKSAKDLNVSIGPDPMKGYLELKDEQTSSVLFNVKDLFSSAWKKEKK